MLECGLPFTSILDLALSPMAFWIINMIYVTCSDSRSRHISVVICSWACWRVLWKVCTSEIDQRINFFLYSVIIIFIIAFQPPVLTWQWLVSCFHLILFVMNRVKVSLNASQYFLLMYVISFFPYAYDWLDCGCCRGKMLPLNRRSSYGLYNVTFYVSSN